MTEAEVCIKEICECSVCGDEDPWCARCDTDFRDEKFECDREDTGDHFCKDCWAGERRNEDNI